MKFNTMMALFAISSAMILNACGDNDNDGVLTLDEQMDMDEKTISSPCIVEVPCNEPELYRYDRVQKYYDFCDSTVTVVGKFGIHHGSISHQTRPITELAGNEKKEMQRAYQKYQGLTQ